MRRLVMVLALAAASCSHEDGERSKQLAMKRAEAAASGLMRTLVGELSAALSKGPPEKAVSVCAEVAQRISEKKAREEGLYLRRTALRIRNPRNAPDAYERRVLEAWVTETQPKVHAEVVESEDSRKELRYIKPILLKPLCVTCHGSKEDMNQEVLTAIYQHYPEDQATDFRPGELRGAVSVRVPLTK